MINYFKKNDFQTSDAINLVKKLTMTQKLVKLKRKLLIIIIVTSILLLKNLISYQQKTLQQDSNK